MPKKLFKKIPSTKQINNFVKRGNEFINSNKPQEKPQEDWECGREMNNNNVKDFIRTLLSSQRAKLKEESEKEYGRGEFEGIRFGRAEILKEIKDFIEKIKNRNDMLEMDGIKYTKGFERALSDILKKLNEMGSA